MEGFCQDFTVWHAGAERVAVRSSANSEDLEKVSGAGLHDSVLGVDIKDCNGCWWSLGEVTMSDMDIWWCLISNVLRINQSYNRPSYRYGDPWLHQACYLGQWLWTSPPSGGPHALDGRILFSRVTSRSRLTSTNSKSFCPERLTINA